MFRKLIPALIVALAAVLPLTTASRARAYAIPGSNLVIPDQCFTGGEPVVSLEQANRIFQTSSGKRQLTGIARIVSAERAQQLFDLMAGQGDISFGFPVDGCYARAHLMVRRLQLLGYRPGKVWSFGNLCCQTSNHPKGFVRWRYHVAPTITTRLANGKLEDMVIDPSMFSGPVPVRTWASAQSTSPTRLPYTCKTAIGEAPIGPSGERFAGTGYWPGANPKCGIDLYSIAVMKAFKPYERKVAPGRVQEKLTELAILGK
jgi:hypothetical protein